MVEILILIVIILSCITLAVIIRGRQNTSWLIFYAKARDAGFSIQETNKLKVAAQSILINDPIDIFKSPTEFDKIIKLFTKNYNLQQKQKDQNIVAFMDRLYEFRKRVEFESQKYNSGIKSSRRLMKNQRLKIVVTGLGSYNSTVLENTSLYLVCAFPSGRRVPMNYSWQGKKISLYLWRNDDAGYVFDSYIIDIVDIHSIPVLHIAHSDSMFRVQKRKSVRVKGKILAYLYLLKRIEGAYEKPEQTPGMKCFIEDLSESGAAIFIGGKAKPGLQVKLQFNLGDNQVVMSGITKSVEYNSNKNQSLIHMKAMAPSNRMRSIILSYVYNVYNDEDNGSDNLIFPSD